MATPCAPPASSDGRSPGVTPAARRASVDEWTLAPSCSPGATRRASATVMEREVNWTPCAPAASAISRRSLMTSQQPVCSCTGRSTRVRANRTCVGTRCPRRCTAPRAPSASITAVARRGKSASSRISGVVTAWTMGTGMGRDRRAAEGWYAEASERTFWIWGGPRCGRGKPLIRRPPPAATRYTRCYRSSSVQPVRNGNLKIQQCQGRVKGAVRMV